MTMMKLKQNMRKRPHPEEAAKKIKVRTCYISGCQFQTRRMQSRIIQQHQSTCFDMRPMFDQNRNILIEEFLGLVIRHLRVDTLSGLMKIVTDAKHYPLEIHQGINPHDEQRKPLQYLNLITLNRQP
jgi:hypothetical protein